MPTPRTPCTPPLAAVAAIAAGPRAAVAADVVGAAARRGPRVGGRASGRGRQTGFNFTEVLFAVMILGIGFIMVAAIFPVAIQQTKLTGEEVQAATTARGGVNYVQQIGLTAATLPVTVLASNPPYPPAIDVPDGYTISVPGSVSSLRDIRMQNDPDGNGPIAPEDVRDILWRQVAGNLILPSDNRVGFVVMYRRGMNFYNDIANTAVLDLPGTGPTQETAGTLAHDNDFVQRSAHAYAQVYVVAVQARSTSVFEFARDARRWPNDGPGPSASNTPGMLEPRTVYVKLYERDLEPDLLTFHVDDTAGGGLLDVEAAAEGAYVIISDDRYPANTDADTSTRVIETFGTANGRIYRLGTRVDEGIWELAPGDDMSYSNRNGVRADDDDIHENIPARPVNPNGAMPANGLPAIAFLVGRGYTDPTNPYATPTSPGAGYTGPSQATGVYVGIVPAN
jgi:hypothetical protein